MVRFKNQLNFLKGHKEYIFSLRFFILAGLAVFAFSALQGYFAAQNSPSETEKILEMLQEMLGPVIEMPSFAQFLFILLNNGLTAFLAVLLGLAFGVFPFLVLFSNGIILGVVAYFSKISLSWSVFFAGTMPHGVIEIPVIILASAVGFKLGNVFFNRIFKKQGSVKLEMNAALNFFLKFLFPLLALAAAIEVFITARLL